MKNAMAVSLLYCYDILIAYHSAWHTAIIYKYKYLFNDFIKDLASNAGLHFARCVMFGQIT